MQKRVYFRLAPSSSATRNSAFFCLTCCASAARIKTSLQKRCCCGIICTAVLCTCHGSAVSHPCEVEPPPRGRSEALTSSRCSTAAGSKQSVLICSQIIGRLPTITKAHTRRIHSSLHLLVSHVVFSSSVPNIAGPEFGVRSLELRILALEVGRCDGSSVFARSSLLVLLRLSVSAFSSLTTVTECSRLLFQ